MFMYAVKKPAVAAAAALGEDGTAVFCEGPGLLFASARGEAPDAGITTAIFNVEKGDIHDGDRWFPGAGSIAEVVFDMPAPLGEKLAAEHDMLADDQIPFSEADLARQQTLGSKDSFLTVGGVHIADREEAIRALRRAAYDVRPGCQETIGPTAACRSSVAASASSTTTGCRISASRPTPPNTFTCRRGSSPPERKELSPCSPRWTESSPRTRRGPRRSS